MSGGKTFQSTIIGNPYDPTVKGMVYQVYITGGSIDSHNKGFFETSETLIETYPTAEAGDYAIVGETNTIWLWDSQTSAWIDSDQKGQVISVNNKTGEVTITARDVNAIPQATSLPEASDVFEDDVVQYIGVTDASYTHGYFYQCVSDGGETPVYSWTQVDVQPMGDPFPSQSLQNGKFLKTNGTTVLWESISEVPSQTGASGKFLTSNGSTASWVTISEVPSQTGHAGKVLTTDGTTASWDTPTTITIRTW